MNKEQAIELLQANKIRYVLAQFVDIHGSAKAKAVPVEHLDMVLTDGGLRVSERHEVIGNDGQPIAGLFAAGSVGQGGLLLYGHGLHVGWAFVSGRRAGRFAASHAAD
jgi:predicted oxidoreductase